MAQLNLVVDFHSMHLDFRLAMPEPPRHFVSAESRQSLQESTWLLLQSTFCSYQFINSLQV